jgi:hypothetical protein
MQSGLIEVPDEFHPKTQIETSGNKTVSNRIPIYQGAKGWKIIGAKHPNIHEWSITKL